MDTVVVALELFDLVVVVVVVDTVIEVVVVDDDDVVDVVDNVVDVVEDENEDPTKPLRILIMNGSSAVVDVVDFVVDDVVAVELVVNFSLLLCSLLLFGTFVRGEKMGGL